MTIVITHHSSLITKYIIFNSSTNIKSYHEAIKKLFNHQWLHIQKKNKKKLKSTRILMILERELLLVLFIQKITIFLGYIKCDYFIKSV